MKDLVERIASESGLQLRAVLKRVGFSFGHGTCAMDSSVLLAAREKAR